MGRSGRISYEIQYTKAADKFLRSHQDIREQFESSIRALLTGDHPERIDVKKIRGTRNPYFRIRLGDCRVVYTVINGEIIVIRALLAGPRGDVYKKMSGIK